MDIINLAKTESFTTKDGSEIRELLAHRNSSIRKQSLAEARVPPGARTTPHYHPQTEEIYYILSGEAQMRPASPKWAHVEWLIARHGAEGGYAALAATQAGGSYRAWVRAFAELGSTSRSWVFGDEAAQARRKGKAAVPRDRLAIVQ